MVISKEILTDYKELYEKAFKLVNEESKNDPPTDPYRSHYTARDVLIDLKNNIKNAMASIEAEEAEDGADYFTYKVIMAFICRDLGRIYVFTEEPSNGEAELKKSLELVTPHKMQPEAVIPYVGALSELGIIYGNRNEHQMAFEKLSTAEESYKEFKNLEKKALCLTDIFGTTEEIEQGKGPAELEKLYTFCCFCLAQVFRDMGDLQKSSQYCHKTLRRQWEDKSYEHIDFALNAATLSQYFIGVDMFKEARHHLSAATLIMAEYEAIMLKDDMTQAERDNVQETFKHRYADVARCWAKYGLALLSSSRERLYNDDEEKLAAGKYY